MPRVRYRLAPGRGRDDFVAFPGENVDGNDFASRAVQSGAGAVVMTREPEAELVSLAQDKGCAILLTDDPEEFLLRLAHAYRMELGCLVVGITGSIGKTTTKDVLAAVLAKRYRVWATKGNFNNLIGMPLTVFRSGRYRGPGARDGHEPFPRDRAPVPVRQSQPCHREQDGQILHIGILGSRENIARAKAKILRACALPATICRCWFWAARTILRRSFAIRSPSLLVST